MALGNFPFAGADGLFHGGQEFLRGPISRVGGSKQDAATSEQRQGRSQKFAEVFLRPKHGAGFRPRKCRRIQQDDIETAAFLRQPAQPIKDIPVNELMVCGRDVVQREITLSPFEMNP